MSSRYHRPPPGSLRPHLRLQGHQQAPIKCVAMTIHNFHSECDFFCRLVSVVVYHVPGSTFLVAPGVWAMTDSPISTCHVLSEYYRMQYYDKAAANVLATGLSIQVTSYCDAAFGFLLAGSFGVSLFIETIWLFYDSQVVANQLNCLSVTSFYVSYQHAT